MLDAIRAIHANGGIIATMCVAARPLAAAGLLVGKEATTYPLDGSRHLNYLAEHGAVAVKRNIVVSERIITGAGPGSASAVAFQLLGMLNGSGDVGKIKKAMRFNE